MNHRWRMPHDSNVRTFGVADSLHYGVAPSLQNAFLEACFYEKARKTTPCNNDNSTTEGRNLGCGTSGLPVERQNTAAMELCRFPTGVSLLLAPAMAAMATPAICQCAEHILKLIELWIVSGLWVHAT